MKYRKGAIVRLKHDLPAEALKYYSEYGIQSQTLCRVEMVIQREFLIRGVTGKVYRVVVLDPHNPYVLFVLQSDVVDLFEENLKAILK